MDFVWNVEEQKLRNMSELNYKYLKNEYGREEKIKAIDTYGDYRYKLTEIFEKKVLFDKEKDTIKHQISRWNGKPTNDLNTNSLKAWCKKNGVPDGGGYSTPTQYSFGWVASFTLMYMDTTTKSGISRINSQIDDLFTDTLRKLRNKEEHYFKEHDEYFVLAKKLKDIASCHKAPIGMEIGYCSDGNVYIYNINETDVDYEHKHKPTIEELKELIVFYEDFNKQIEDYYNNHILDIKF